METVYYLKSSAGIQGPLDAKALKAMAATGKINPDDGISHDKQTWVPASKVRGLPLPVAQPGQTDDAKPYEVFISYSSKNKAQADAVCSQLESSGIRCWIAPRDILPGTEWTEGVLEGIDSSRIMVLVFSDFANQSSQVRREVERAISKNIPLIPFRIENVPPVKALEFCLGNTHWLDAYDPPLEQHIARLRDTVLKLRDNTSSEARGGTITPVPLKQSRQRLLWGSAAAIAVLLICVLAYFVLHSGDSKNGGGGGGGGRGGGVPPPLAKVDLLAKTILPRDSVEGSWVNDEGMRCGRGEPCRLEFPYILPEEYDLRVSFVPLSDQGPVNIALVGSGHPFVWTVSNNFFSFSEVNGKVFDNVTKRDNPRELVIGQSYVVLLKVRKTSVEAQFNGTPRNVFVTNYSNVSIPPRMSMRSTGVAGVGTNGRSIRVTSAELTEISGHGKPLY